MLGRVVLILAQLGGAWFFGRWAASYMPLTGTVQLAIFVLVFTAFTWLIGIVGAEVLQGIERPSGKTFGWTLVLSAIAALISFIPQVTFPTLYLPLIGAVLGYHLSR